MTNYEKFMELVKNQMHDCEKVDGDCNECPWSTKLPRSTRFKYGYKTDGKLAFCDLIEWGDYDD